MTEVRKGLRHLLARPWFYDVFQTVVGANAWRKKVIVKSLNNKISANSFIIDIGCGTSEIVSYLPSGVRYLGIGRNPNYIASAKEKYGSKNKQFLCQEVNSDLVLEASQADAVLAIGLIHHLDDQECTALIQSAKKTLRPGGFFLALDPVYHQDQSIAARYVISKDRGKSVRTTEQYLSLYTKEFAQIDYHIETCPLRIPYTGIVFRCYAEAQERKAAL